MRRGLVLEGGGAKGAYAMGILKAFHEAGFRFDAVSGSSSGALNAAILATEQREFGEKFWTTLSFRTVCGPTNSVVFYALLPLHLLGLLLHVTLLPFSPRQRPRDGLVFIAIFFGFPLVLSTLYLLVAWTLFSSPPGSRFFTFVLVYTVITALCSIPFVVRAKGWHLMHVRPLRAAVSSGVAGRTFEVPTYVTLARRELRFDPDQPGFYNVGGDVAYIRSAMEEEQYVPEYLRMDKLEPDQQADVLVATGALPFGVFPSVHHEGVEYVDGGVADNLPVYPLIEFEQRRVSR